MIKSIVTIVIPCFNASEFIRQTLTSILSQDYTNLQVVIVDDGSNDNSKDIIKSFTDKRIIYLYQENKGVSAARNLGLGYAKGEFLIFFDADDIMTNYFLSSRIDFLNNNNRVDFVSSDVIKFSNNENLPGIFSGATNQREILLYDAAKITCPSSYLFRTSFLIENKILFKEQLSSTADRYFLLQCLKVGKSEAISNIGQLKYRVSGSSMSANLNFSLVKDNEKFYVFLLKSNLIPPELKRRAVYLGYYILFASYWKINFKLVGLKYGSKAFLLDPFSFIKKLFY